MVACVTSGEISPSVTRVRADQFDWAAASGPAAGVRRVVEAATEADGRSPLNEQTLLSLRHDGLSTSTLWISVRHWSPKRVADAPVGGPMSEGEAEVVGFALVDGQPGAAEVEMNLVVHPDRREEGVGSALATAVLEEFPAARISAWSHGNHDAAAAWASSIGFSQIRSLWIMRLPLTRHSVGVEPSVGGGRAVRKFVIRTFQPGRDEDAVLRVNAAAFADHPEQGGMTRTDLDQRMVEPWFDPAGFFVAESESGELLGFHWTKVHPAEGGEPAYGEVYVVGISPEAQGMGLGKQLTLTGLRHLESLGLGEVILYVESDNAPAIAVYEGLGFTHAAEDTDVMYAREQTDGSTPTS